MFIIKVNIILIEYHLLYYGGHFQKISNDNQWLFVLNSIGHQVVNHNSEIYILIYRLALSTYEMDMPTMCQFGN